MFRLIVLSVALIALVGCAGPLQTGHNPTPGASIDTPPPVPAELVPLAPPTLPPGTLAAWTPEQALHLDVGGRVYATVPGLHSNNGRMFVELDDGTRVWVPLDAVGLRG